ncbi:hypothetical protein [Pseudoduganella aquatica]|nr:hypothetical protein [Pseudoduganella aquatica]
MNQQPQDPHFRRRLAILAAIALVGLLGLAGRLVWLQAISQQGTH